jgi:hypothetical protein
MQTFFPTILTADFPLLKEHNLRVDGNGANCCRAERPHDGRPESCCTVTRPRETGEGNRRRLLTVLHRTVFRPFSRLMNTKQRTQELVAGDVNRRSLG